MKFKHITVKDFQGIKEFKFTLSGMSWKVYAKNGTGKSTVFRNAITWLLFEKDSKGRQLDPKPRENDGAGERIRGRIPEVELVIELDNGTEITLLRRLEEDVTKKTKLYKGDKGYWEVDGLPVNKTQFSAKVEEIIGDTEIFSVMLNPEAFLSTKTWNKRRDFLEKMLDDSITPEELFDDAQLEMLKGKSIAEAYEIAKVALKKAENKLAEIPPKLEEAQKKVGEATPETEMNKEQLKEELDKVVAERQVEEENCKNPDFSKRAEITGKIKKLETQAKDEYNRSLRNMDVQIEDLEKRIGNVNVETIENTLKRKETRLEQEQTKYEKMKADFKEFKQRTFNETKCITCGQELPEYLREQYEAKFNEDKAETEKELIASGKSQKVEIEELQKEIVSLSDKLDHSREEYKTLKESYVKLIEQKQSTPYTEPEEIAELRSELKSLSDSGEFKKSERLMELEGKEEAVRTAIANHNNMVANQERVKQLEREEEELGDVVTECKRIKNDILNMQRKWSQEIENRVNSMFQIIKWRLSEEQKNGEPKDICEAMYNGVDYNTTVSNGEAVNMCLDLHNTISNHFGIKFPAIIDNAESVTDWLVKSDNQMIFLYAKEDINELKMEALG